MDAQRSRCGHNIFVLWFLLQSFFLFFVNYSQPSQIGCLQYFHTWCGLSVNLRCRSETCCTRLAEIQDAKDRHLGTIAQLSSGCIFATKAYIDNRKHGKQQYFLHMSY